MSASRPSDKVDITRLNRKSEVAVRYRSVGKVRSFTVFGFPLIIPLFFVLERVFQNLSDPAVALLSFFVYVVFSALVSLSVLERKIDMVFGELIDREGEDDDGSC